MIDDEGNVNAWKVGFWIVAACVFFLVLWLALASAVWGLRVATAGIYGQGQARIQIQSASSRIANYEHFFNLCASVQANEGQLDSLNDEISNYEVGSKDRARVLTNITGVNGARLRAIAQYNQDALKDYTGGQFRDSSLPYQLAVTDYPEGGRTQCALQ